MKPGASLALRSLPQYLRLDESPRRARDLLSDIALGEGWSNDRSDAAEKGERWEEAFLKRCRRELSELNSLGRAASFAINSSSPDHLQGSAFVEPVDPPEAASAKQDRSRMGSYVGALQALTPQDFERLCGHFLALLGVQDPKVTAYTADEGIDFYGHLDIDPFLAPDAFYPHFSRQMSIWLVGQAKHYQSTKVATPDLRELVGSVTLAKALAFGGAAEKYSDLSIRACDPVYFLFFTTGAVSADAWRLTKRSGMVTLDGEMIAAYLCARNVGFVDGDYEPEAFADWLARDI